METKQIAPAAQGLKTGSVVDRAQVGNQTSQNVKKAKEAVAQVKQAGKKSA